MCAGIIYDLVRYCCVLCVCVYGCHTDGVGVLCCRWRCHCHCHCRLQPSLPPVMLPLFIINVGAAVDIFVAVRRCCCCCWFVSFYFLLPFTLRFLHFTRSFFSFDVVSVCVSRQFICTFFGLQFRFSFSFYCSFTFYNALVCNRSLRINSFQMLNLYICIFKCIDK